MIEINSIEIKEEIKKKNKEIEDEKKININTKE